LSNSITTITEKIYGKILSTIQFTECENTNIFTRYKIKKNIRNRVQEYYTQFEKAYTEVIMILNEIYDDLAFRINNVLDNKNVVCRKLLEEETYKITVMDKEYNNLNKKIDETYKKMHKKVDEKYNSCINGIKVIEQLSEQCKNDYTNLCTEQTDIFNLFITKLYDNIHKTCKMKFKNANSKTYRCNLISPSYRSPFYNNDKSPTNAWSTPNTSPSLKIDS
jgi:hypothetical protein